jgi:hypothetical protein
MPKSRKSPGESASLGMRLFSERRTCHGRSFRPVTPMTMSKNDRMRSSPAAAPKKAIPIRNVPAAPIPVQTA